MDQVFDIPNTILDIAGVESIEELESRVMAGDGEVVLPLRSQR